MQGYNKFLAVAIVSGCAWAGAVGAVSFSRIGNPVKPGQRTLIEEFDRELESAKPGQWSLSESKAYQALREEQYGTYAEIGGSGVINGNDLPANTFVVTFDDGPGALTTPILSMLDRREVKIKATFFWQAQNVLNLPSVVRDAESRGHSVQHHSFTHRNLGRAGDRVLQREIVDASRAMRSVYSKPPRYFRPPFGNMNPRVKAFAASERLKIVLWNIDSLDWHDEPAEVVANRVLRQMEIQKRGIILFHDTHPNTLRAAQLVIEAARRSSVPIRFLTVDEAYPEPISQLPQR